MTKKASGYPINAVANYGVSENGHFIHFELQGEAGNRIPCIVPFEKMNNILLALQIAMQAAIDENAKRPGFDLPQLASKIGIERHGVGHAVSPSEMPLVVLYLQMKTKSQIALMLPKEQADEIGNDLIREAAALPLRDKPKPS